MQVIQTIYALSSRAEGHKYTGASIGVKISEPNEREFDEETIAAGKSVIGQQAGWNKGANQSGMNIGNCRHITD